MGLPKREVGVGARTVAGSAGCSTGWDGVEEDRDVSWPYATLSRSTDTASRRPLIFRTKCFSAVSYTILTPMIKSAAHFVYAMCYHCYIHVPVFTHRLDIPHLRFYIGYVPVFLHMRSV